MNFIQIIQTARSKSVFLVVFTLLCIPSLTHAQYSYNGKSFDSFEAMQRYIVAYMEAWREVYGNNSSTQQNPRPAPQHENKKLAHAETGTSRDVDVDSVRFVGTVDYNESDRVRVWFDYGTSPTLLNMRTATQVLSKGRKEYSFDAKAQQLDPARVYYYRAGLIDGSGNVDYGTIRNVRTSIDISESNALVGVSTKRARDIEENRATLNGSLALKKEMLAYYWFEYGDSPDDLYKYTPKTLVRNGDEKSVTYTIRRLDEEEEYFYRIVAMDSNGKIRYGKTYSFTTKEDKENEAPKLDTLRPISVGTHTATLVGTVDMNDFDDGSVFFVYGEDRNAIREIPLRYTTYEQIRERGDARQKIFLDADLSTYKRYEKNLTALDPRTRHYYAIGVAYENEEGDDTIVLGKIYSFTTKR